MMRSWDEFESGIEHAMEQISRAGSDTDAHNKAVSRLKEVLRDVHHLAKKSAWPVAEAEA